MESGVHGHSNEEMLYYTLNQDGAYVADVIVKKSVSVFRNEI